MNQSAHVGGETIRPDVERHFEPVSEASALSGGGDPLLASVGYFAGWFGLGRLAAARRLARAGVREPLLNDA